MSSEVYNLVHSLARAIKQSEEYQALENAQKKLEKDEKNLEMLKNLREKQLRLQSARLSGNQTDEKEEEVVRKLQELVQHNPTLREYLEQEQRFFVMYNDIMQIIGEAVDLGLGEKEGED